ncbi:MAG: uroporphyrinogen-III C-methyltransferase [Alphaproteobacteria bacterium]|jgi:uroporphyrin-III C-methyltransferase|nr:uroporphyrinogen-III C-methyltransferase [Alphaproteobacteria bacterium]
MTELGHIVDLPDLEPGWVWLAGAGPGDPGLVTLLTAHALRQADAVVYDALVDERVLALARPEARLEFAGKRGGKPSPKQRDISARLIELAGDKLRVLRLKGGDPFVFGRGGEEALALVRAGVPFRVVPGITAGVGGLAYAGIPTTHRDTNSAVTFITGHGSSGELPDGIDWQALARGTPVLVLYMALKHLDVIAERLLAGGRTEDEPVAVISRATTPGQRVLETTLGRAAAETRAAGLKPPALVVLGPVVAMRPALDWLGALEGRVLMPGPFGAGGESRTG